MREELPLPTSVCNSSFPINISWVVPSPRSRSEGEAVPGWKPGIRLPNESLHTFRAKPSNLVSGPHLLERPRQARRAPREMIHALIHPTKKAT